MGPEAKAGSNNEVGGSSFGKTGNQKYITHPGCIQQSND
jgi:hypothetical protein